MNPTIQIDQALSSIRALVWKADSLVGKDFDYFAQYGEPPQYDNKSYVESTIEMGFLQLLALSEALGLNELLQEIKTAYRKARKTGLAKWEKFEDQSAWSFWSSTVTQFADSIAALYGKTTSHVISKDVIEILRATQYAITDRNCFSEPPNSEDIVHRRIEAVLRCIFPHLDHKPAIQKAMKNFIPDTGLPAIRTLIEYKYVQSNQEAKRVSDEIRIDTQGYKSNDWDNIIFVIYETKRLTSEKEWNRMLQQCDTSLNTQAIVLHGEVPEKVTLSSKSLPRK